MSLNWRTIGLILSEVAGVGVVALLAAYLSGLDPAGARSADNVVTYGLLFVGPLLVFLPPSVALRLGPLWLLGAGSWALLGYVLVFVPAPMPEGAGFFTYAALLALIFVALASALAVPVGFLGKRLLPPAGPTAEMMRALRQGGLLSLFVVSLLAMSPLGLLNWLNAFLVFTIVALTEFFFLARD